MPPSSTKGKKVITPIYKRVMTIQPHCPRCQEQLLGNNSSANPFKCQCGMWEMFWLKDGNFAYKITKKKK